MPLYAYTPLYMCVCVCMRNISICALLSIDFTRKQKSMVDLGHAPICLIFWVFGCTRLLYQNIYKILPVASDNSSNNNNKKQSELRVRVNVVIFYCQHAANGARPWLNYLAWSGLAVAHAQNSEGALRAQNEHFGNGGNCRWRLQRRWWRRQRHWPRRTLMSKWLIRTLIALTLINLRNAHTAGVGKGKGVTFAMQLLIK